MTAMTALASPNMHAQKAGAAGEVVLEDDAFLVAFSRESGVLTRCTRKASGWNIERRPELGMSFRLLVPLSDRRTNYVYGEKQKPVRIEKIGDHKIEIEWNDLASEHGGVLPITFIAAITLTGGALTFDGTVHNNSDLDIETIDYPYFGDLSPATGETQMTAEYMSYGNLVGDAIYPEFKNEKGYWGVNWPTKTIQSSKHALFALIQSPREGLYVGMNDPTQPYLLEWTFEQHPGVIQSTEELVPQQGTIAGVPVHLEFRTCHFIFAHAHATKRLAPVVIRGYDGDWHAGVDVYKQWRATWFRQPYIAAWVKDLHSWQQIQIDGAEQDYSISYRELPKYIDLCAENGVTAIQLVGWAYGGQDGGDPSLDTDPGLGTWDDLHHAILYANSKGVKIVLFGKPIWADMTRDWTKKVLYKYACTDPYGIPYETEGYSYTTPTQLAGINNRRRLIMDVQCQEYRDIATREFLKTVKLDAAGWLFDEVCHHGPVQYSFASGRGYDPPGYVYGGDMPMARQFREAADKTSREFIFAGEGPQDWLMQYYPVSYFRMGYESRAVCRYIDPEAPLLVAVTGFDDREKLNLVLMNRYIISYEPYNFHGKLTDFPDTLAYGKKIDALRSRYREFLWDAEFRDTMGATLEADGPVLHSVFVAKTGKSAVVLVNKSEKQRATVKLNLPNANALVVATPEAPSAKPATDVVTIPPRSAAVVMES